MPRVDTNNGNRLQSVEDILEAQRKTIEGFTTGALHRALFFETKEIAGQLRADVIFRGSRRFVTVQDGIDADTLVPGDEVFLDVNGNCIVGHSAGKRWGGGELVAFVRRLSERRLVVKHGDELLGVDLPACLAETEFAPGDLVRIDREQHLAFEKLAREEEMLGIRGEADAADPEAVGGQEKCLQRLLRAATAAMIDRERAARYGLLDGRRSILLKGAPGTGKTLMARVCGAEISRLSGKRCAFLSIRPAEWERKLVGEGEALIRGFFRSAREMAQRDGCVLICFDEIDSGGRIRGERGNVHSDRYVGVLLSEIDGMTPLRNVVLVSTCNSVDRIDPALLERLAAVQIEVSRPDLRAARAIFGIHLPATLAFSPNGSQSAQTRAQLIDAALARLCGPPSAPICSVRFRDATPDRIVRAKELLSGRLIQQIGEAARLNAFYAEPDRGVEGVQAGDMAEAVETAIDRLRRTLTSRNIRAWIDDLPEDVEIAAVEPVKADDQCTKPFLN